VQDCDARVAHGVIPRTFVQEREVLRQPELAATLGRMSVEGPDLLNNVMDDLAAKPGEAIHLDTWPDK
jgi:hypothetical protein